MHIYLAESSKGTYVVTFGVADRLQTFRSQGFKVPRRNSPVFADFQKRALERVGLALPGATIRAVGMNDLMRSVRERVEGFSALRTDLVALSTCFDMAAAVKGRILSINRLFDAGGRFIGYGPRPGHPSLAAQVGSLAGEVSGRSVILAEDGAFTGHTLRFVVRTLEAAGIRVSTIVVGFCCLGAEAVVRQAFGGRLVVMNRIESLIDWLPDHDLFPFVPHCGRVLGRETPEGVMPVTTPDGASYAFPYILPFGRFGEWASLPARGARDLSAFFLDEGIRLFGCIAERSGLSALSIRDLVSRNPHVSIPAMVGSHGEIPPLDADVVAFLRRKREEVGAGG